jgi:uncharacterized protein YndB with AHSA1/START domain
MADKAEAEASSVEIADAGPLIVASVRLPGCSPERALLAFTDPAILVRWWRGELAADLVPGGEYSVAFPAVPARLTGEVLSYEPGESLEFSWAWEGEVEPPSTVRVTAVEDRADGGVVLTIVHGPHEDDEPGRTAHQLHWEGWEHFLPRLPSAVSGS